MVDTASLYRYRRRRSAIIQSIFSLHMTLRMRTCLFCTKSHGPPPCSRRHRTFVKCICQAPNETSVLVEVTFSLDSCMEEEEVACLRILIVLFMGFVCVLWFLLCKNKVTLPASFLSSTYFLWMLSIAKADAMQTRTDQSKSMLTPLHHHVLCQE